MGHDQLVALAKRQDAAVVIKPVNMGAIFSQTGGLPLAKRAPARQAYRFQELERWRRHLNIPLTLEPAFFPANDRDAAGMVIAANLDGADGIGLAGAFLRAVWAEERNIADPQTAIDIANAQGLDGQALLAAANSAAVTAVWEANTAEAMEVGVFGAPTYVYGAHMFWGQDRLDFLERAIQSGS
ncbi:MAG: 2-hydroxychromene-2-carboxylate isomerase [Rhodospirillales bacterium]|nr:2-hydroxychromene-2-carboxylate isomerase [Rhodospirillales bacterium]